MSDIRVKARCQRCQSMFLMRACSNFTDLCDTCQTFSGQHATEASIRQRNDTYRYTRERFAINADGNPHKGSASVFLPGLRSDEPAPSLDRMRQAIRKVKGVTP